MPRHQHHKLKGKFWKRTETGGYKKYMRKINRWYSMGKTLMTEF